MPLIDVKQLQEEVRKELNADALEIAKDKLKTLYHTKEKAQLSLKNIERQIEAFLSEVSELATYEAAGVATGSK